MEEFLRGPGDEAALTGKVEADSVDAVTVVIVEQQVTGERVDLFAAESSRVGGGFAVQEETVENIVGVGSAEVIAASEDRATELGQWQLYRRICPVR